MATDSKLVEYQRNGSSYAYNCVRKVRRFQQCGETHELHEQEKLSAECHFSHCSHGSIWEGEKSNQFKEAEEVFETLLDSEKSPLKPYQKMFHMMIYMHKKAGSYEKDRRVFSLMAERGVEQSTVTYNSLMSFENNYKEVSKIYDQMKRASLRPDVVNYALLVNAYGKARREDEALAVFEEMMSAGQLKKPTSFVSTHLPYLEWWSKHGLSSRA